MKKVMKWLGIVLGLLVAIALAFSLYVYFSSESEINRLYQIEPTALTIPEPDSAVLARGEHLSWTLGCRECHAENLAGQVFIDAPPMGRFVASNLTPAGVGQHYDDRAWVLAIRHGVGYDGRGLMIMPSQEYSKVAAEDLGPLIAYLKTLEPISNDLPETTVGPVARALVATGQEKLSYAGVIDHDAPFARRPTPAPTAEYGAYLAALCQGCHGENYAGGLASGPPGSPLSANLTPHADGLADYSAADIEKALRTGVKKDGTQMDPAIMPWPMTSKLDDTEMTAVILFLQSLEPVPTTAGLES